MARTTQGPERTGGKGSAAAKKQRQAVTPGHQHGQKLTNRTTRGSATYTKRPGQEGEEPSGPR
jgi:hypothetical protein